MSELFTTRSLVHAIAGSAAGSAAVTLFYPLNTVRTRAQLNDSSDATKGVFAQMVQILQVEGLPALYNGLWSNVACLGTSNFVYFYLYNGFRAAILAKKKQAGHPQLISAAQNLIVSSIAGSLNVLLTNPLWVSAMRITSEQRRAQTQAAKDTKPPQFSGVWDAVLKIARDEGVSALWNGAVASLMLVSNPVLQFVVYEYIKKVLTPIAQRRGVGIRAIEFFLMAAFSKAVATVFTYPIQLAQSLLRNSDKRKQNQYEGTADCLSQTYQRDGLVGLFRGMEAKLWQTVLAAAFHFVAYEKLIQGITSLLLRQKNKA
eukprot:TRINITY_DN17017_c0_g1_i1.p1 TRINITY_DN17017_c0_g1~~TRINITY_DN17017_c0_g1_i1.p1  ORF type:complete len:316 (-),score=88.50 TRINITY_DN17017_c0_g1_i1:263-1210(-)